MIPGKKNSYNSLKNISVDNKEYKYYSLKEAEKNGLEGISNLPKSLKVLLENLLRYEDDLSVNKNQINSIKDWLKSKKSNTEIAYRPARVLLQDYTGIPAVADLAAMREAVKDKNKDPNTINPLSAVDLVIDHSVQVDQSAKSDSFENNVDIEFERNGERYSFLKWGPILKMNIFLHFFQIQYQHCFQKNLILPTDPLEPSDQLQDQQLTMD